MQQEYADLLRLQDYVSATNSHNSLSLPQKTYAPPGKKNKKKQGTLYHQPKQCTITREIPQNYHTFAACVIPPKMGPI